MQPVLPACLPASRQLPVSSQPSLFVGWRSTTLHYRKGGDGKGSIFNLDIWSCSGQVPPYRVECGGYFVTPRLSLRLRRVLSQLLISSRSRPKPRDVRHQGPHRLHGEASKSGSSRSQEQLNMPVPVNTGHAGPSNVDKGASGHPVNTFLPTTTIQQWYVTAQLTASSQNGCHDGRQYVKSSL